MRIPWNKRILTRDEMLRLRKMYFQKKLAKDIAEKTGLSLVTCGRIYNERKWYEKRERYYRYLCYAAYKKGISISRICSVTGCLLAYAIRVKKKYKIATKKFAPNKRMTKEIERKMVLDYFDGISSRKLAKKYGFKTGKTVTDILSKNDISFRHPTKVTDYNTDCFREIDSNEKAYILGFLLTDGYVIKDYSGIGIQITETDGYVLEYMKPIFGNSCTIAHINCEGKRKKGRNSRDMTRLCVHNKTISHDLKKFGVIRNKTYDVVCPKIDERYQAAFCRGIWDGDGTVGIAKSNNIWCNFCTVSEEMAYSFVKNMTCCPCRFSIDHPTKGCRIFHIRVAGGNAETIKFLRWIYKDKGIFYLRRKYAKVQDQIN